jgi:hypothetical protein
MPEPDDGITDDFAQEVDRALADMYVKAVLDWAKVSKQRNLALALAGTTITVALIWAIAKR